MVINNPQNVCESNTTLVLLLIFSPDLFPLAPVIHNSKRENREKETISLSLSLLYVGINGVQGIKLFPPSLFYSETKTRPVVTQR